MIWVEIIKVILEIGKGILELGKGILELGKSIPPTPPTPTPPSEPPQNLPHRTDFVGRDRQKAGVHEALKSRSCLVSIHGFDGIGKTSLALEVAHECLSASKAEGEATDNSLFSGFIWTSAKDRDLTIHTLLDTIARTLEFPGIAKQSHQVVL